MRVRTSQNRPHGQTLGVNNVVRPFLSGARGPYLSADASGEALLRRRSSNMELTYSV